MYFGYEVLPNLKLQNKYATGYIVQYRNSQYFIITINEYKL